MCCLSLIEPTEKLKQQSGSFPGIGAFEQLFGPVRGKFEPKFSKDSNARGVARGKCRLLDSASKEFKFPARRPYARYAPVRGHSFFSLGCTRPGTRVSSISIVFLSGLPFILVHPCLIVHLSLPDFKP